MHYLTKFITTTERRTIESINVLLKNAEDTLSVPGYADKNLLETATIKGLQDSLDENGHE